jgi:asparagine synthase (glutamine-hydrolysing)
VCGIFGYSGSNVSSIEASIIPTLDAMKHRGPDSNGFHVSEGVILGHSRLAIIDLSEEAHQPMHDESNRFHLVYNGELYNYLELKSLLIDSGVNFVTNSDTEVVLKAYIFWGDAAFAKFRGMFALAIWDTKEACLLLARDSFGEKPLYFIKKEDNFYFGSELRSLVKFSDVAVTLNKDAINLYLHYQFVPEPYSLINGIEKLEPGTVLRFFPKSGDLAHFKYLDIFSDSLLEFSENNLEYHAENVKSLLKKAVERCMVADVPIVIALSAGIDSSSIVNFAVDLSDNVEVISVGYPGYPDYDERIEAKRFAEEKGIKFHDLEIETSRLNRDFLQFVWQMDEPIADPAAYAHFSVAKEARELGFKVLLSGIGGDELFWGYDWLAGSVNATKKRFNNQSKRSLRAILARFSAINSKSIKTRSNFFYEMLPDFLSPFELKKSYYTKEMLRIDNNLLYSIAGELPLMASGIKPSIAKALGTTWLSGNCLALADKVSMANSIESRMPFLDVDLAMYAYSLNYHFDVQSLGRKRLLIKALGGVLPSYILERRKTGFQPPVLEWMTTLLKSNAEVFFDSELVKQNILTQTATKRISRRELKRDWPEIFFEYKLLLLEIWVKRLLAENNSN